jgi:serine/threonine protein kinase
MTSDDSKPPTDSTLDMVLREVARPPELGAEVAAHLRVPADVGLSARTLIGAAVAPLREPLPGEVLDERYELERVLGRGGMGVVYAAKNLRTGKSVAIKWISGLRGVAPEQGSSVVERFRREARALAGVHHPNIVDVYDVGGSAEAPFLVMELLEGETLRERLVRGPCSWDEACSMLLPVLRGVAAVHRAGTVHRDLKPDNIFLCAGEGGAVMPKVLDFGVAAIRGSSSDGLSTLTRSGTIVGTPSYMPLEQLTGGSVDERADVYALGVVLYEALSGALPFAARSASELAVLQATTEPTPLSVHCPALRGAREAAVMQALSRKPRSRHDSLEALAEALERASRSPHTRRAWLWAALVGMLLAGLAFGLLRHRDDVPAHVQQDPRRTEPPASAPIESPTVAPPEVEPAAPAVLGPAASPPPREPPPAARPRKAARADAPAEPSAPAPSPTDLRFEEF